MCQFFVSVTAHANQHYCKKLITLSGWDSKECQCNENLYNDAIQAVKEFPLVAFCGYKNDKHWPEGAAYFSGSVLLNGKIERYQSDSLGNVIEFNLAPELKDVMPLYLHTMRLGNEINKKLLLPKSYKRKTCWITTTTLYLEELQILEDSGTDFAGSFPIKYNLLKIGEFQKCQSVQ